MRSGFFTKVFSQEPRQAPTWAKLLTETSPAPQPAVRTESPEGDRLAITPKLAHARFSPHADLQAVLNGTPMTSGAKGEGVKALQAALLDLGFGLPSGADGAFGNELKLALKGFQSSQGLPLTGELDAKTLRTLDAVAPAAGKKAWEDADLNPKAYLPAPQVNGKPVRVAVDTSEHRLFLYDKQGQLERIYPIATGAAGTETDPMIKIVSGFLKDPTSVARQLWPESGKVTRHGEELHGTFTRRSIGTDASHGCMRLYNEDIKDLYGRLRKGEIVVVQK